MKNENKGMKNENKGIFIEIILAAFFFGCGIFFKDSKPAAAISLVVALVLLIYLFILGARANKQDKVDGSEAESTSSLPPDSGTKNLKVWNRILTGLLFIMVIALLVLSSYRVYDTIITDPTPSTPISSTPTPEVDYPRPLQGRIAAGYNFTVALRDDGSVVCIGGDGDIFVENWEGIKQIAAYGNHILGLYQNGAVAFTGKSVAGEREVSGWRDIAQVAACYEGSIGLRNDGTVLYTGFDKNKLSECESWSGIKRILGGEDHIVALTNTGNIVTSGYNGGGSGDGRRQDFKFNDVVEGYAASGTTFCVFSDGSVAAYGTDWADEDMIGGWSNIVAISGGDKHTVGLEEDGTVVAMGSNEFGQCNVKGWSDIIAVYCGQYHTVGLKSDGTLVATGLNTSGQCDVEGIDLW